jgi:hypothetical protein
MQARVPAKLDIPSLRTALRDLVGRLGTVQSLIDDTAFVRWDDGSAGSWPADCEEA